MIHRNAWIDFLKKIIRLLPRKRLMVQLTDESGVTAIDRERGIYIADSDDPHFTLAITPTRLRSGWYYLATVLNRPNGDQTAKIYIDPGTGYHEKNTLLLSAGATGQIREFFHLPRGVRSLRWDPMESPGYFEQGPVVIHKITGLESYARRIWPLLQDWHRLERESPPLRRGMTLLAIFFNTKKAYERHLQEQRPLAPGLDYSAFIQRNGAHGLEDPSKILEQIAQLPHRPRISIIMPVYNPSLYFFREAIHSVLNQWYPDWELCLADDASTDPRVREIIEEYQHQDPRIKAIFRSTNGHISAASNSALELASGAYIALLDQDDLLPRHALYHVAVEINRHPQAELLYSDEDKIDGFGLRSDPYFKPDWNPELFYSHNMISHLGVYRHSRVKALGGFRQGYEGSQDYDLALRLVATISPGQIRHIPRVLYHWRIHEQSVAADVNNKPYAHISALRALSEHLLPAGATVTQGPYRGSYRVRYPLPTKAPLVSLIIPTRDMVDILRQCITSIVKKTDYPAWEILVVDNQSLQAKTLKYFKEIVRDPRIRILRYDAPFNYSAINNFAVSQARGTVIGLINNDIEVISPEWLTVMMEQALRPEIGAVGAQLLYPDGRIQHAGVVLGFGGVAGHAHLGLNGNAPGYYSHARLTRAYSAVTGACLLVRKEIYEEVGGLDEIHLKVAFNDIDFCLKIRQAGYRTVYTPYARLYHHESLSRGYEDTEEKQKRFAAEVAFMQKKWGALLQSDPYYNPNLAQSRQTFSLAAHPVQSPHHGYPLSPSADDRAFR